MVLLWPGGVPLVDGPQVSVQGPHRGELMLAVPTGGVPGVVLLVAGERFRVVENLRADITDILCRVAVLKTKP